MTTLCRYSITYRSVLVVESGFDLMEAGPVSSPPQTQAGEFSIPPYFQPEEYRSYAIRHLSGLLGRWPDEVRMAIRSVN